MNQQNVAHFSVLNSDMVSTNSYNSHKHKFFGGLHNFKSVEESWGQTVKNCCSKAMRLSQTDAVVHIVMVSPFRIVILKSYIPSLVTSLLSPLLSLPFCICLGLFLSFPENPVLWFRLQALVLIHNAWSPLIAYFANQTRFQMASDSLQQ